MSLAAGAAGWRVHLPTAGQTVVQAVARDGGGGPWPSARALTALLGAGAARSGPPRALGTGHEAPLVASQPLRWAGLDLELECRAHPDGLVEVSLTAPPWDGLAGGAAGEEEWWDLVDAVVAAVDARHGAIGDGEPLDPAEPSPAAVPARLRHHLGLLVGGHLATAAATGAALYRALPCSGLVVLLR